MVEPDSAEPIWKTRAACRGVAAYPASTRWRRWLLGGPISVSVGAITASAASDKARFR